MSSLPDEIEDSIPVPDLPAIHEIDLSRTALFLDVDGTLLEIAPEPSAVRMPKGLPSALADLAQRCDGALALVSGRMIANLDRLFAPMKFAAAGCHGAEIRTASAGPADLQTSAIPEGLRRTFLGRAHAESGVLLEEKGATLALHYRAVADPSQLLLAMEQLRETVAAHGYDLLFGKKVVELRPHGIDKGTAIRTFMASPPFADRVPMFAGDDVTDNDAFAQITELGGLCIAVGARNPLARYWSPSPANFRQWLRALRMK